MTVYITLQDVDGILGSSWAAADKKSKAVLQANTWMTGLNLQDIEPENIPDTVKQAGAYAASVAAAGNLYQQKTDSGVVTSKSVEADDVKVSRTFAELSTTSTALLDPDLQLALAMLKPWMLSPLQTFFVRA
ncbi:protein singed [Erwinia sp. S38]|uniref:protein singed n=1 Tax=Erwinia sp. S38 TaxID=2769338 RepID=UPI00190B2759|nr:protein singed [Erwinia sp. S38]MBK0003370.1 protein singed [Erwinia sp. S38]